MIGPPVLRCLGGGDDLSGFAQLEAFAVERDYVAVVVQKAVKDAVAGAASGKNDEPASHAGLGAPR